jgi:Domain of unknown function (DUF6265)
MTVLILLLALTFAQSALAGVESLAWMSGSWTTTSGGSIIEEHWTKPAGGTLIGMGRTLKGEKTAFFEFLRIETRPDGIFYVAEPKGRPPVDFKMVEQRDGFIAFANPQHDFPQRITYTRITADQVLAEVSGPQGGKTLAERFEYRRMK